MDSPFTIARIYQDENDGTGVEYMYSNTPAGIIVGMRTLLNREMSATMNAITGSRHGDQVCAMLAARAISEHANNSNMLADIATAVGNGTEFAGTIVATAITVDEDGNLGVLTIIAGVSEDVRELVALYEDA